MNKGQRHIRIRDIISNYEIETQDQLVDILKDAGCRCYSSNCFTRY